MTWQMVFEFLMKFGPEGLALVRKLIEKWSSTDAPSIADIDELIALGKPTARDRLIAALTEAKIPLDSPQAVALLALV